MKHNVKNLVLDTISTVSQHLLISGKLHFFSSWMCCTISWNSSGGNKLYSLGPNINSPIFAKLRRGPGQMVEDVLLFVQQPPFQVTAFLQGQGGLQFLLRVLEEYLQQIQGSESGLDTGGWGGVNLTRLHLIIQGSGAGLYTGGWGVARAVIIIMII